MGKKIRIGYDGSVTLPAECRGVGRYTLELLREMVRLAPAEVEFVVLLNSFRHRPGERHRFLFEAPNVRVVSRQIPGPALLELWRSAGRPTFESLVETPCDVVHAPSSFVPPARAPRVVTVFDLGFLRDPGEAAPYGGGWYRKTFPETLPATAAVLTPSRHVAEDVIATYGLDRGKVHAIHLGIDGEVFQPEAREGDGEVLRRHGLRRPYILAVSDAGPRKRPNLVFSTADALREAGHPAGFATVGLSGDVRFSYIRMLPWISDGELAAVYRGAEAAVLTTREEGFGFPLLEAMACGAPVVCARHSSLGEIGGDHAHWVEEETTDGFAKALTDLLSSPPGPGRRLAAARHARSFTWEACAERVLSLYRRLCPGW